MKYRDFARVWVFMALGSVMWTDRDGEVGVRFENPIKRSMDRCSAALPAYPDKT